MKATIVVLLIAGVIVPALGHSQMRCLNYVNGACQSGIRAETNSYNSQAYRYNFNTPGSAVCQANIGNPLSSAYGGSQGSSPMGSFTAGQTINVMWFARNHAIDNQKPGTVTLYLSPSKSLTGAADSDAATFQKTPICTVPYSSNCGPTGDAVPCTASCTIPSNIPTGYYTFLWWWDWRVNDGNIYTTCADALITAGNGQAAPQQPQTSTSTSNVQTSTSTKAQTSTWTSNAQTSQQTSQQQTSQNPATSSTVAASIDPAECTKACTGLCGDKGVVKCDCSAGYNIVCGQRNDDDTSSSSRLVAGVMAMAIAALYLL